MASTNQKMIKCPKGSAVLVSWPLLSRVSTAMLTRDIDVEIMSVRPSSVRPPVTLRYCIERA